MTDIIPIQPKSLNEWTLEDLSQLPIRHWDKTTEYDSVMILSSGNPHDSGWAMMVIVGVNQGQPVEIASTCSDDIEWLIPDAINYAGFKQGQFRMDCALASGGLHVWSRNRKFRVDAALSTVRIELFKP